jgi:pentatricopeptide repeat protein
MPAARRTPQTVLQACTLIEMRLQGLPLTRVLSCLPAGDQAARAEQLFDRLCSVCKPDASTFNCLVRVYCRLGKVREATNMLEIMLRSGQQVELTTFDAAIDACWATGIVPLQQLAQQLHQRAQQQGLFPTHVLKQVRQHA